MRRITAILLIIFIGAFACQKAPKLPPSSDPLSPLMPPPMGAATYNDELKRELILLDDILEKRVPKATLERLKVGLYEGDQKLLKAAKQSDEGYLVRIFMAMPELLSLPKELPHYKKEWFKAKLYFVNRRFVEAALLLSDILKQKPDLYDARNYKARSMFFLGNPDGAVSELKSIIDRTEADSAEALDALYLTGAIYYESHDHDKVKIQKAIEAWKSYLQKADAGLALKEEITQGLNELSSQLKGQPHAVANLDPFMPQEAYGADKNALLKAFMKEELILALELSDQILKKQFDKDVAVVKARILFKTGRHHEAQELYTHITKKYPSYAPGFHYQGMAFMMQAKPEKAIECWQTVLAIDKPYGEKYGLGQRIGVAKTMLGPKAVESH